MKKHLLTILFCIAITGVYAQTITYGLDAGLNFTKLPASADVGTVKDDYLLGFHAGGLVDIGFKSFSIQPGLFFTTKGGKTTVTVLEVAGNSTIPGTATGKTVLNYIELPVNLLYRAKAGNGNFFIGGGPYIAVGVSGKATFDSNFNGQTFHLSQNVSFGSGDNEIKNPDFGVNGLLGYQLNSGFMVNAGYGLGLLSTSNGSGSVKNKGFSFSLGYFFK